MKSLSTLLVAAFASLLAAGGVANAQSSTPTITECSTENQQTCQTSANRTCYNYAETATHECGYCLNGYFEFEDSCYSIDDIGTEGFLILATLLELYVPDYVDPTITTEERALRLKAVAKIISVWNSAVPPPEFELGLTNETFLTEEERKGRLGIDSSLMMNEASILSTGSRGEFERFDFDFVVEDDGDGNNFSEEGMATDGDGGTRLRKKKRIRRKLEDTPSSVDWDEAGYTTNVKNQGLCGCCWAVSVAGAVESALMITNQTSRYDSEDKNSLSVQQMISCDKQELGCQGGNILMATRYVWEHDDFNNGGFGGLYSAKDWPYTDILGKTTEECNAQQVVDSGSVPAAYLNYPKVVNSVNDRSSFEERRDRLMAAVAQQPVTSVIRSGCDLLMSYSGGVLTHDQGCECCETSCIDHAIVIVGYDASGSTPYWKLRNSWGTTWGEEGHFRIAMNDASCGWGLFGMLAEAALPSDSYKNLEDLPERPSWWETAQTWEKVLVILFSILGFCCLCSCVGALFKRRK